MRPLAISWHTAWSTTCSARRLSNAAGAFRLLPTRFAFEAMHEARSIGAGRHTHTGAEEGHQSARFVGRRQAREDLCEAGH
jgi:hypothetical protein